MKNTIVYLAVICLFFGVPVEAFEGHLRGTVQRGYENKGLYYDSGAGYYEGQGWLVFNVFPRTHFHLIHVSSYRGFYTHEWGGLITLSEGRFMLSGGYKWIIPYDTTSWKLREQLSYAVKTQKEAEVRIQYRPVFGTWVYNSVSEYHYLRFGFEGIKKAYVFNAPVELYGAAAASFLRWTDATKGPDFTADGGIEGKYQGWHTYEVMAGVLFRPFTPKTVSVFPCIKVIGGLTDNAKEQIDYLSRHRDTTEILLAVKVFYEFSNTVE